jgi:hypothetical protein
VPAWVPRGGWACCCGGRWYVPCHGFQNLCSLTPVNNGGYLSMGYYWRDHNRAFNLASLARSIKFLGPDPSGWTTDPFGG